MELIAFIILCYIIYRVFFKKKKPDVPVAPYRDPVTVDENIDKYQYYQNFKREPIVKEHFDNINQIEYYYKVANSLGNKFSPQMEHCILLCCQDINLYNDYELLCMKYDQEIESYPSFTRLAIIYEKREQYEEAVDVCTQALIWNFDDNGSIYPRLARLLKKTSGMTVEEHLNQYIDSEEVLPL